MEHHTSASIEIRGSGLRYAEVERDGGTRRLVRLGSCNFDFDLEARLSGEAEGDWVETFTTAVRDILAGSAALDLHVALHRPLGTSLFVPIPVDTPKSERLRRLWQDVAVAFPGEETAFSAELLRSEVLPDGENIRWWHVLAVPAKPAENLERILSRSEVGRRRFCASMSGAAAIVRHIVRDETEETPSAAPYRLAVGRYEAHTEVVLIRNQAWQFGTTLSADSSSDRLYQIYSLLDGMEIPMSQIVQIYAYGSEKDGVLFDGLETCSGATARPLDPLMVVEHQVDGVSPGVNIDAYAPCVGANLRDVYA